MLNDLVFECDGINDCEDGNDEKNCCKLQDVYIICILPYHDKNSDGRNLHEHAAKVHSQRHVFKYGTALR